MTTQPLSALTMLLSRHTRRRQFITLLGGAAAWPVVAWAQQLERVRRVGVLLPADSNDAQYQAWVGAFLQGLALSGWTIGRNVRIDTRWATANAAEIRKHAAELAALAPDVILASGNSVGPLLQANPHSANRVPERRRSDRRRFRRQPGAAGRQRHRFHLVRIQSEREMAGVAQADYARRDARGGPSGFRLTLRLWPVRHHPGRGAVASGGCQPGQCARCRR